MGVVRLDCSWPSSTWCWPKIGGGGRGDEKGEEGVRKLHSVHMTCAAPPHPSKIFSLFWDFLRVETLLNEVFKREAIAIDAAKYRVGERGRRKVGTGSQSQYLHVLHLLGDSSSSSDTNPSVFVVITAKSWPKIG